MSLPASDSNNHKAEAIKASAFLLHEAAVYDIIQATEIYDMLYRKIRLEWERAPERLYREFYVGDGMPLSLLANIIMELFRMKGGSIYEFETREAIFAQKVSSAAYNFTEGIILPLSMCILDDLTKKFTFVYDFWEGWMFMGTIIGRKTRLDDERPVILLDGKGAGITENNIYNLLEYVNGRISPDLTREDDLDGMAMTKNLGLNRMGDFDAPLDLEAEQERLDKEVPKMSHAVKDRMDDFTFDGNISYLIHKIGWNNERNLFRFLTKTAKTQSVVVFWQQLYAAGCIMIRNNTPLYVSFKNGMYLTCLDSEEKVYVCAFQDRHYENDGYSPEATKHPGFRELMDVVLASKKLNGISLVLNKQVMHFYSKEELADMKEYAEKAFV